MIFLDVDMSESLSSLNKWIAMDLKQKKITLFRMSGPFHGLSRQLIALDPDTVLHDLKKCPNHQRNLPQKPPGHAIPICLF